MPEAKNNVHNGQRGRNPLLPIRRQLLSWSSSLQVLFISVKNEHKRLTKLMFKFHDLESFSRWEIEQLRRYLFKGGIIPPIFRNHDINETVGYLKDLCERNKIKSAKALEQYYDKKREAAMKHVYKKFGR